MSSIIICNECSDEEEEDDNPDGEDDADEEAHISRSALPCALAVSVIM